METTEVPPKAPSSTPISEAKQFAQTRRRVDDQLERALLHLQKAGLKFAGNLTEFFEGLATAPKDV